LLPTQAANTAGSELRLRLNRNYCALTMREQYYRRRSSFSRPAAFLEAYASRVGNDSKFAGVFERFASLRPLGQTPRLFECFFGTFVAVSTVDHR